MTGLVRQGAASSWSTPESEGISRPRKASSRWRNASSRRSFSAIGRAASLRRTARLLSRIFCRSRLMSRRSRIAVQIFDVHIQSVSNSRGLVQFFKQLGPLATGSRPGARGTAQIFRTFSNLVRLRGQRRRPQSTISSAFRSTDLGSVSAPIRLSSVASMPPRLIARPSR